MLCEKIYLSGRRAGLGALAVLAMAGAALAQAEDAKPIDVTIFPEAKAGFTRHVMTIAPKEHEGNHMVEIVAGRTMSVDCNNVMIRADLEDEDLKGWGYTYYEIDDISEPASTMMGCPDGAKTDKFISFLMGSDAKVRYNSKLPLVVYAPEGVTVGYRIWSTDGVLQGQDK